VEHFWSHSGSVKHSAPVFEEDLTRLQDLAGEAKGKGIDNTVVKINRLKKGTRRSISVV